MEILSSLFNGFGVAFTANNLLFCLVGVTLGTLIGALPGLGPTAGIAVLIPLSVGLDPTTAIIMLAGIYYGSMYGSSTTAILINTPGQGAAVLTAVEGFELAKIGRAGPALGMSAIASFIGGTLSLLGLILLAPPLAELALGFGPSEYFALMVLGMTIVVSLSGNSLIKGLISAFIGLAIVVIGLDPQIGSPRFTFGSAQMSGGIDFISVVVGLFAVTEILIGIEQKATSIIKTKMKKIYPTKEDMKKSTGAIGRGTLIGFFVGLLPGGSATVATFLSYDTEKKLSKYKEEFSKGSMPGLAAVESANNSATSGGMVPLLTLGIPASAPLAILMGALLVHGLQPGPMLFQDNPTFVWGLIASMYIGNIMLLILNLPLIRWWAKIADIPFPVLGPLVLALCVVGTYGVRNSMFDVWAMLLFGILGYILKKLDISLIPLLLAVILGPMLELYLRQAMTISRGSFSIFYTRPLTLTLLLIAAVSLFLSLYNLRRKKIR